MHGAGSGRRTGARSVTSSFGNAGDFVVTHGKPNDEDGDGEPQSELAHFNVGADLAPPCKVDLAQEDEDPARHDEAMQVHLDQQAL